MTLSLSRSILSSLSPAGKRARLTVLTYHSVPNDIDPFRGDLFCIREFRRQMQYLCKYCNVLALPRAARLFARGQLPARAAVITFDDGYADNLYGVAPVLKNLGLQATFFVTASAVDEGIMWNDLVIEGIRCAGDGIDLRGIGLGCYQLNDARERRSCITQLIADLKYRQLDERLNLAKQVYSTATSEPVPRLMMTRAEVAELSGQGFDVGAHTMTHPILQGLSDDEARWEISSSFEWIREVTGNSPDAFAYPNGRPGVDFSERHMRFVEDAGFSVAVSTRWACATQSDSIFALPRYTPWEYSELGFWLRLVKTGIRSYLGD